MIDQAPQIPPAVIEFAKENDLEKCKITNSLLNDIGIFQEKIYNIQCEELNYMWLLIYDRNKVRFAKTDEIGKYINICL